MNRSMQEDTNARREALVSAALEKKEDFETSIALINDSLLMMNSPDTGLSFFSR